MRSVDRSRAYTKADFQFVPFRPSQSRLLAAAGVHPKEELIVFERCGVSRGLLACEMSYHHVCQGDLAGEPFLVSF